MVNVFSFFNYREFLRTALTAARTSRPGFTHRRLAESMRVQPSYLSRVFQGTAHLNADQLYLGGQALRCSAEEVRYLLLLLEWDRCELSERKFILKRKIQSIQEEKRNSAHHLKADFVLPESSALYSEYYLDPMASLVHTFLSLKEYQTRPERICVCLGLSEARLREILALLTKLGIVAFDKKKAQYSILKDHIHLDKDSTLNRSYQTLFRHAALEHLKRVEGNEKYEFSVTFSADEETQKVIHDEFNSFLKRIESQVRKAPAEGVFQLHFDLFRWDTKRGLE